MNNTITAVEGILVGHATDEAMRTGCTVVLMKPSATVAVDTRGGYPTTFDTHGVEITKTYTMRHAIFLSGGDVFGLNSGRGVQRYLLESGTASDEAGGMLPLVVGATIYDMDGNRASKVDYEELAIKACRSANSLPAKLGRVGVGAGASVGKFAGYTCSTKSGIGSKAVTIAGGITVAAISVPNSVGNIYDFRTGRIVAGARKKGRLLTFEEFQREYVRSRNLQRKRGNTTLAVVATDANLSHEELVKVAQVAHNGLALAIRPVHTSEDGDTVFAVSTSKKEIGESRSRFLDLIAYSASIAVAESIVSVFRRDRNDI